MQAILKLSIYMTVLTLAGTSKAGQVAVINPSSGGGVAIAPTVSVPTVAPTTTTPTATVSAPPATVSAPTATVSAPTATVSAPTATVSAPTATVSAPSSVQTPARTVSTLKNSTTTVTQETGLAAGTTSSSNTTGGGSAATSTPTSVSGYAPQLLATIQSVNVSSFTPQQANALINIIDAQISRPGTPATMRQALSVEKARLAAIASN